MLLRSLCVVALLTSCSFNAVAATHEYAIRFDESLETVFVRARLDGYVDSLRTDSQQSSRSARSARHCGGRGLRYRWGRLGVDQENACIRYSFALKDSNPFGRRPFTMPKGLNISSPSDWLYLPKLGSGDSVRVTVTLPDATSFSTPWPHKDGNTFEFGQSPGSGKGLLVVGDFIRDDIEIPGATLRVAILPGAQRGKVLEWLEAASMDVALVSGHFPNPSPQVLVIPASNNPNGEAVPFGRVVRDRGESVHFFINPSKPQKEYLGDWTATHEFAHLLLPYIHSDEKWISEGFASYHQNVLLGRAGVYSEQDAWRRLHRSFSKARKSGGDMSPNSTAHESFWEARMMIYWSGAAIALLADVELRKQGQSLNEVLGKLRDCCLPGDRIWRGRELFQKLDELSDTGIFMSLYDRYADTQGMPNLDGLYQDLGIIPQSTNQVTLDDKAPHADIRKSIAGPRARPSEA